MTDTIKPTKAQLYKQRLVEVLADLQEAGVKDGEALAMIGTLAADIARTLNQKSWSGAKAVLTVESYEELLGSFQKQGKAAQASGKLRQAYALQALAVSLMAKTQRADADVVSGEKLLDGVIDRAVRVVLVMAERQKNENAGSQGPGALS